MAPSGTGESHHYTAERSSASVPGLRGEAPVSSEGSQLRLRKERAWPRGSEATGKASRLVVKRTGWIAGLALVLVGLTASVSCAGEVIKVGLPLPLTGTQAEIGNAIWNGYLLALEEINAAGGLRMGPFRRSKIEFLIGDTASDPEVARSAVEKLITQDKVPIIAGESSSSNVLAVAAMADKFQMPYLCQTGAADEITQQGWKWVFRINPPASEYA